MKTAQTIAVHGVCRLAMCSLFVGCALPAAAGLVFYAPLDGHSRGVLLPHQAGIESGPGIEFMDGQVGQAAIVPKETALTYPIEQFLSNEEGSVAVWVLTDWDPAEAATRVLVDLGRFASLRRWQEQPYLTYSFWYHHIDEKHDYGCTSALAGWESGQWRHLAITWSWQAEKRALYIDGQQVREAPIHRHPNVITTFRIGPDAKAADELCVYSHALTPDEVRSLYEKGAKARTACDITEIPKACGAILELPADERPDPPDYVNWSFEGAEQRENGLRCEVTLHGWWRWQRGQTPYEPPAAEQWLYRKIPAQSHYCESFPPRDDSFSIVPASDPRRGSQRLDNVAQWCEREFSIPSTWSERRLELDIDSLVHQGAVYLNGRLLDALPQLNLGGDYDITELVTRDQPNRLTIFSSGVDGSISLRSLPADPRIDDAWLVTSWRRKRVTARVQVVSPTTRELRCEVHILDDSTDRTVQALATTKTVAAGQTELILSQRWSDATPWSLEQPHLYRYRIRLLSEDGRERDETLPVRFGFREIWIDGGDFLLNGRPIRFVGHSNSHLTAAAELGDSKYVRYSLEQWQKAGLNAVTPWQGQSRYPTLHPLLDIADEIGMAMFPVIGLPSGERGGETPELRAGWHRLYRRYIRRYRQHASVLGWMVGGGSHGFDFCPAALDGRYGTELDQAPPLRRTWAFVEGLDSTRPTFGLSNGDIGPVWTSMAYQGFDVDLQERENWPLLWSKHRRKPLMPCEFSLPYYRDWFARTRRRSGRANYAPENTQCLATEYGAMFLGPTAYESEPEKYLASIQTSPGLPLESTACLHTKLLFADTLQAWRAYGMSFVYHAEVPWLFTGSVPDLPSVKDLDPRRWGATPENLHGSLQARDELSEFGQRVRAATAPVLAFIGGANGQFTRKDHAFWSGERIEKALVVVNDTDECVRLQVRWRLEHVNGLPASGSDNATSGPSVHGDLTLRVDPGHRETRKAAIRLRAPQVETRSDWRLVIEAQTPSGDRIPVRPFAITVFARPAPNQDRFAPGLMLFDPIGDTRNALDRLSVTTVPWSGQLSPQTRLVIGRHVLEDPNNMAALEAAGFDDAVQGGMRVLVFEQAAAGWEGTLLGLRLKRIATRRTFVRCPRHPVLAGFRQSDLQFLRGDSDLIEARSEPEEPPTSYPLHFWHWGNDHIAATYAIEKPQVGACRALLDCGVDLAESAILETARADGLLVFCQLDVTNRAGRDPVSTRLVRNLVRYLADGRLPAPAPSLEALARKYPPQDQVEGYTSPAPDLPGIHAGDLFFREKLRLPAFAADSATPLFASVQEGDRTFRTTSLTGATLTSGWQQAKRARIEAALRFLNGQRCELGPTCEHADDPDRLYPHRWNRIEAMDEEFDPYVYWRW